MRITEDGRSKTITLTADDLADVADALGRYQAAKDSLDAEAAAGIAVLRARLAARRQSPKQ